MPLGLVLTQPALAIKPKAFLIRESEKAVVTACAGGTGRGEGRVRGEGGRASTDSSNDPTTTTTHQRAGLCPPGTSRLCIQVAHHRVNEPVPLTLQGLTTVWGPEHCCLQKPPGDSEVRAGWRKGGMHCHWCSAGRRWSPNTRHADGQVTAEVSKTDGRALPRPVLTQTER